MKGKIQIGNRMLDVEIEIEEKPMSKAEIERIREETIRYLSFYPVSVEYVGGEPKSKIVDGSLVEPITDPTKLLESPDHA